jgi:hypothetical protein
VSKGKGKRAEQAPAPASRPRLASIGLEAEFALFIDDAHVRPEDVFGTPTAFIRRELMHRSGTSYHLPTGGAVYFDTGVIEVATPLIEIAPGCGARAGRSLWEGICFLRDELDAWQERTGRSPRMAGFSTHYNVTFDVPPGSNGRTVERLAYLLAHVLPAPVMVLAANRRSTGVGVRPRSDRIEVTVDFTPSPALMIATATLITGIVREVMHWADYEPGRLEEHGVPRFDGFAPVPHTSRKGWLARYSCFPANPFACDVDEPRWRMTDGAVLSLRDVAGRTARVFWRSIRRASDPFTFRLIGSVLRGRAPSLLELEDRPPEYDDVGRLCRLGDSYPVRRLSRSGYEQVLINAIAGRRLLLHGQWLRPVAMQGWTAVVFRGERDGRLRALPLDFLLRRLRQWERPAASAGTAAGASAGSDSATK